MHTFTNLNMLKVALTLSPEQLAQFRSGTGSNFDPNSWLDRNKAMMLMQGGQNWADNAAARTMGRNYEPPVPAAPSGPYPQIVGNQKLPTPVFDYPRPNTPPQLVGNAYLPTPKFDPSPAPAPKAAPPAQAQYASLNPQLPSVASGLPKNPALGVNVAPSSQYNDPLAARMRGAAANASFAATRPSGTNVAQR